MPLVPFETVPTRPSTVPAATTAPTRSGASVKRPDLSVNAREKTSSDFRLPIFRSNAAAYELTLEWSWRLPPAA